jgi:putative acyl-CoA dehydrogenase
LQDSLKLFGIDQSVTKQLDSFGEKCGSKEMMDHSDLAEKNKPSLRQFDNYGRRIDIADYHPSYHVLMKHATNHGCSALGFKQNTKGSHVARAALIYMENQLEPGHCCPIVMTCAAIPVLQRANLGGELLNKIMAQNYDPRDLPVEQKTGATVGMSMTEKQGGSDVRANTTVAVPVDANKVGPGSSYHLTGHKVSFETDRSIKPFEQLLTVVYLCPNE